MVECVRAFDVGTLLATTVVPDVEGMVCYGGGGESGEDEESVGEHVCVVRVWMKLDTLFQTSRVL